MTLPAPLTPPGCDLRDFPKLMIDIPRLFASGFNATASRKPLAWMLGHKLWYRSWHQVPAGSLPNDDDELCHLAELGFDTKSFGQVRALAMRGWVECSDGRLYHPVVCEAALEGWQEKLRQRLSSGKGNESRWGVTFDPSIVADDLRQLIACLERLNPQSKAILKARKSLSGITGHIPPGASSDPTGTETASHRDIEKAGMSSQETGTGTGILEEESFVVPAAPEPTTPTSSQPRKRRVYPEPFEAVWRAYPHVEGRSSKDKSMDEWDRLPEDEREALPAAIVRFKPKVAEAHGDRGAPCMSRWLKDGKHLNWIVAGASSEVKPEVWAQAVTMWRNGEGWAERLGPAPDQPGTRVPRELLLRPLGANDTHRDREAG